MTCPTPIQLSQLVDGELAEPEASAMRAHAAGCDLCTTLQARLAAATAGIRAPLPPSSDAGCLPSDRIAGWVQHALTPDAQHAADEHVGGCDACLAEAITAARMMARLAAGPTLAVPATLRARVASRWAVAAPATSLTTVVVGLSRAGARLLARHLIGPILSIDELPMAAAPVRGENATEAVRFRICAPGAEIHAVVVPSGEVVALTLTLVGPTGDALVGQRVFVRRQGRSVFSARTDDAGALHVQRIETGVYEVSCPGIGTSFRLDLRR